MNLCTLLMQHTTSSMYKEATVSILSSLNICLLDIDLLTPLFALQKFYSILEVHETVLIKYIM